MSKVVAMVGQKGGVGKSALARLVAVQALLNGTSARIMDLDPSQGTSTQWQIRRDRHELEPEVSVEKCRTVAAAMKRRGDEGLLVLDGPAFADKLTLDMAKASDLVILPSGFGVDDLTPQIEAAYELEEKGIPSKRIRIAFTRARGSSEEERQARRFIAPTGVQVLEATLREMPSIRQAHNTGRAACETGFASVDAEAQRVAVEILTELGLA